MPLLVVGTLTKKRLMNILKSMLAASALLALISCEKLDVTVANLWGDWYESYDSESFCMDGTVKYSFFQDGVNGELFVYDALSGKDTTFAITYLLEDDILTINPVMSDPAVIVSYEIVKLSRTEMAWQKLGTEYSEGTWGSDYRHFIR